MAPAYSPTKLEMARQVKAARLKRKLSLDKAAALVGTSRQQWIRWEKAQNMPTDYAEALSRLLELPPGLFVEEAAPNPGDPFRRPNGSASPSNRQQRRGGPRATGEVAA